MDAERFRAAYQKLQYLDERFAHRVRPRSGLSQPTPQQLDERVRELASYTLGLREVVGELFQAIAARPSAPSSTAGEA